MSVCNVVVKKNGPAFLILVTTRISELEKQLNLVGCEPREKKRNLFSGINSTRTEVVKMRECVYPVPARQGREWVMVEHKELKSSIDNKKKKNEKMKVKSTGRLG